MKLIKLLLTIAIMASINLSAAVLWQADFESPEYSQGELAGQPGWEGDLGQIVTNAYGPVEAVEGSQFEYVDQLAITFCTNLYDAFTSLDPTNDYVTFSYYVNNTGDFNNNVGFYDAGGSSMLFVNTDINGSISFPWNGGALLGNQTQGEWTKISVDIDCVGVTWKVISGALNDGPTSVINADFSVSGIPSKIRIRPYGGSNLVSYSCFDDFKLETSPAFRVDCASSLAFTNEDPQELDMATQFDGLDYDVTISTEESWILLGFNTTNIDFSGVNLPVAINTTGLDLPASGTITITGPDGQVKIVTVMVGNSLICYDGFDATLDTSITNTLGGIGWSAPTWSVRHAWNVPLDDSDSKVVAGLTYATNGISLVTSGNAILVAPVVGTGNEGYQIQRATVAGEVTEGVLWESYLLQPQVGNLGLNDVGIFPSYTVADNGAFFGAHWSTFFRFMNGSEPGPEIVPGETYFVVVKIDKDSETAYAWVNPDLDKEPILADAIVESRIMPLGGGVIIEAKINAAQNGPASYVYDEYRLGHTWVDVAPVVVPEPATLSMLLLSLIGFVAYRRR